MALIGKKIELARRGADFTQDNLADRIGVSRNTLNRWENGHTSPSYVQLKAIASATNKDISFFVADEDDLDLQRLREMKSKDLDVPQMIRSGQIRQVPIISWVYANQFKEASDPFSPGVSDEYINTTQKGGERMFALRVKNDCMEPEFFDGDIIIVNPNVDIRHNDFVIVRDNQKNEATFKQFKKYGDKVVLHPLNPKYNDIVIDDDRFVVAGKIVEKVKKY